MLPDEKKLSEIFAAYAGRRVAVARNKQGGYDATWSQANSFLNSMELLAQQHGLEMVIWGHPETPRAIAGPRQLNVFIEPDKKGGFRIAHKFTLGPGR